MCLLGEYLLECLKIARCVTNSVDPDQMVRSCVRSGLTIFVQMYLFEYLGKYGV